MRTGQEEEERAEYEALPSREQLAIWFLLDCAASRPDFEPVRFAYWMAKWKTHPLLQGVTLAAYDALSGAGSLALKCGTDVWGEAEEFFGEAAKIGSFVIRNGYIRSFEAFDFLFVRLFGGKVRSLTPSLFAASLLHPDVLMKDGDDEQLWAALMARSNRPSDYEPMWFPNRPLPEGKSR
jgi:hypothetical protein